MSGHEFANGFTSMLDASIKSSVSQVDRRWVTSRVGALIFIALSAAARSAPAGQETDDDAPVAGLQRLLAKIKAQHPGASILKVEMRTRDLEGRQMTYEVKLLARDGRVVRLVFDARTLDQPEPYRTGQVPGPQRRRLRRHGNW